VEQNKANSSNRNNLEIRTGTQQIYLKKHTNGITGDQARRPDAGGGECHMGKTVNVEESLLNME
jgi:hypothetical protein